MVDEPTELPSGLGIGAPSGAEILPVHMIPDDILQKWAAIPADQAITVNITKQDLDNLFVAISNAHLALDTTNRAFVQWSNRQVLEAQSGLEISRHGLVAGMNSLRHFFEAIISRAVGRPDDA